MDLKVSQEQLMRGMQMNEAQFDEEFNLEDITNAIVNQAKADIKAKFGNKKRHRQ
jgi:hypothetical protein